MSHPPHDAPDGRSRTRGDPGEVGVGTGAARAPEVEIACVGAVVHSARGALLLVRRARPPAAGCWSVPGGHVEPGEDDATALVREVREETGLVVTAGARVGTVRRAAGPGRTYVVRDYRAEVVGGGEPAPSAGDDAADARWVDAAGYAALEAAGALVPGLVAVLEGWGVGPR